MNQRVVCCVAVLAALVLAALVPGCSRTGVHLTFDLDLEANQLEVAVAHGSTGLDRFFAPESERRLDSTETLDLVVERDLDGATLTISAEALLDHEPVGEGRVDVVIADDAMVEGEGEGEGELCGNGRVDDSEACDGGAGGHTCFEFGLLQGAGGGVACTACALSTAGCSGGAIVTRADVLTAIDAAPSNSEVLLPATSLSLPEALVVERDGVVLVGRTGSALTITNTEVPAVDLRGRGSGVRNVVINAAGFGVRLSGAEAFVDHVDLTTAASGLTVDARDVRVERTVIHCGDAACTSGVAATSGSTWSATISGVWITGPFNAGVLASGDSNDVLRLAHVTIDGVRASGVNASAVQLCASGVALFDRGWTLSSTTACAEAQGHNVVKPLAACTGSCVGLCPGPLCDTLSLNAFDDALCPVGAANQIDPPIADVCDDAETSVGAADIGAREAGCSWQIGANDYSCP